MYSSSGKYSAVQEGAGPRRVHYGVWVLIAGILTTFGCIGLGRFAIGLIIPEMGAGLGLSNVQLGTIVSGTFFGYLASTVVSGNLAARFGPKRVIAASMLLVAAGMAIAGVAYGFFVALVGQLLVGIGAGGSNVPTMGLITRWYAKRLRGLATGLMTVGSGMGFALAGAFVPYLSTFFGAAGWRASWFLISSLVAAIAVLGIAVFKNSPADLGIHPVGSDIKAGELHNDPDMRGSGGHTHSRTLYSSRTLWKLGATYFMFGFSYVVFTTFFAKYLVEEVGFSTVLAGQLWAAIGIASIVSGFSWGKLSDSIGRKRALFLAYFIQGACLLALAVDRSPAAITAVAILYALTLWSIPSVMAAASADYAGGVLAPAALGMITVFFGVGQVLNPWISGYIIDITHSFAVPFLVSAGASILGAALAAALPRQH